MFDKLFYFSQKKHTVTIYEKNLQGDIVAIYSNIGTLLVSDTCDAWGDVEIITQYEQILLQGDKIMYGLCCFYDDVAYDALIQKYIT